MSGNAWGPPDGFHDAEVWLQVEASFVRRSSFAAGNQEHDVRGLKVVSMTQTRPKLKAGATVAMKVTLRLPDSAFLPLIPEAIIVVPEDMVISDPPIVVDVLDPHTEEGP